MLSKETLREWGGRAFLVFLFCVVVGFLMICDNAINSRGRVIKEYNKIEFVRSSGNVQLPFFCQITNKNEFPVSVEILQELYNGWGGMDYVTKDGAISTLNPGGTMARNLESNRIIKIYHEASIIACFHVD